MKVSVVIPTFEKTLPYLERCVTSLRESGVDWDIVVVSNGGPWYKIDIPGITRRLHTEAQGQCIAVNIGTQSASDYFFISNDDMYYAPGWNKNLRFEHKCFSPNLLEPTDNAGSAPPFLKIDGGLTLEDFKQDIVDEAVDQHVNTEMIDREEDGFNLPFFISYDLWQTIGGYDEAYDPWGSNSDTDLQTLIELAGVKPKRLRDVLVYHFGSKSGTFDPERQAYWQNNFDYYTDKFGFNRDQLGSDTWYCRDMIDYDKLRFNPDWLGKYAQD